ncbi:undecaprenyl/decaprenyl-phosphate alpha-N-acetylglucosaminyl 1-phosphate transferase [Candidatus Microgenomates bacterium]|nr:undecaprenyl/decaprenyl-phosphate alpha-N-acetylglucosaminyl 1-phosphate transferase [Candidatus Microgenomates bacterium]
MLITPLAVSFLVALAVTPLVIKYARTLGVMDDPQKRPHPATLHRQPVARGGGIPIFLAVLAGMVIFLPWDLKLVGIASGALVTLIVGLADDRRDIPPIARLFANFLAALLVVYAGITIPFVTNPLGGIIHLANPDLTLRLGETEIVVGWLAIIATIIWIMAITNIVSWSSGVDGQLAGFVPIAAATIGALSLRFGNDFTQWPVIILSLAVAGSFLGFLFWSVYPQKIMPGYSGGALAGYFLAVLAIISGAKLATAIIVLGIPIMDAIFSILRRLVHKRSPFWGDAGHLHHRLLAIGWSKKKVAAFYWLVAAVLGMLAIHLNSQAKLYTIIMLVVGVGGLLLWLTKLSRLFEPPE